MLSDEMPSADTGVVELANKYMHFVSQLKAEIPGLFQQVNEIIDNQRSLQANDVSVPEVESLLPGRMPEWAGTGHQCQQTDVGVFFFYF